jgi:hypothetical protein
LQQNYSTTNLFSQTIREQSPCFPVAVVSLKGIVEGTISPKAAKNNNKANNKEGEKEHKK